ncbi:MAG: hypothetical protein HFE82_09485 [Erysipelotrichaceae bacterium]|nr:hypothetical protein [Erysipelotrichaceae bacterium]
MKVIKIMILKILLLIIMILCGTVTMKILDLLFKLGYENIWEVGFKVGVIGWISSLAVPLIIEKNKEKKYEK